MELANVTVRLGGLLTNTVPKIGITPAEILVLQHIHGSDAVVDIRPAGEDNKIRHEAEFRRLAAIYDGGAGAFTDQPGAERDGVMSKLFPGAVKRLPVTLEEIGITDFAPPAAPPVPEPEEAEADEAEDADEAEEAEANEPAGGAKADTNADATE